MLLTLAAIAFIKHTQVVFKHFLFLLFLFCLLSYSYWLPQDQFCQLKWRILIWFIVITILQLFSYFFQYMYNKNDSPNILSFLRNDWSKWQIFLKPWSKRNHWFLLKYSTLISWQWRVHSDYCYCPYQIYRFAQRLAILPIRFIISCKLPWTFGSCMVTILYYGVDYSLTSQFFHFFQDKAMVNLSVTSNYFNTGS